jgi:shikimate kinase
MSHLFLVGMMGSGKSTIGRRCAAKLGRPFVDTDDLVVTLAGMPVAEIFATRGEAAFRAFEKQAVGDITASPEPHVVATGGGAVLDPDNRRRLRDAGVVVWLRASVDALSRRVGDGARRPLLAGDPRAALTRLETTRAAAYEAVAHLQVDTTDRDIDAVVNAVLDAFAEATSS